MIVHRAFRGTLFSVALFTAAVLVTGCMDPKSDDKRGYTKAPLEHAGWVVKGEEEGAMRKLGTPNQTRAEIIEVAETPKAAAPTGPAKPAVLAAGVTQAMVDDGRKLFNANPCFACHGTDGAGTPIAPQLSDKTWINLDGSYPEIIKIINNGVPKPKEHAGMMPPKGGAVLSDDQVKNIAAYIYSISH
jgi:mono/diheme cytochrome c family protein